MIPRNQVLTPQQIVANKAYLKKLHIDPKKTITSQEIETAFNQLIKLQPTDKPSDSKVEGEIKAITEAHDKLLVAIKYASPGSQKMAELEEAKTKAAEQLQLLQKKIAEHKLLLSTAEKARAEIKSNIELCDLEQKTAQTKLDMVIANTKISMFKAKYTELFKHKSLSSRLKSENFLKGKENLNSTEYKKQIEAKIENKPIGTVADAWDAIQKTPVVSDEISSLRNAINDWQQKLSDERKRLKEFEDYIANIDKDLPSLEMSHSEASTKVASIDTNLAQFHAENLKPATPKTIIPEEKKLEVAEAKKTEIEIKKPEIVQKKVEPEPKKTETEVKKEELPLDQVIFAFKKIYRALRAGQSGWRKNNFMADKESLEPKALLIQIENYVKDNPNSREEAALKLAKKHYHNCNTSNLALFSEIYQWSFENSSLIKVSQISGTSFFTSASLQRTQPEFSETEIKQGAEKSYSRTAKICNALS